MPSDRDSLSSALSVVKEIGAHFSRSLNNLALKHQKRASSFHHNGESRDVFFPPTPCLDGKKKRKNEDLSRWKKKQDSKEFVKQKQKQKQLGQIQCCHIFAMLEEGKKQ